MTLLDLIQQQFGTAQAEHLGAQVGLDPDQAHEAVAALLPAQLGALTDHAQHQGGAQHLLDQARNLPSGTVQEVLARPGSTEQLTGLSRLFGGDLLGDQAAPLHDQVAAQSGASSDQVQRLGLLTLPLLLGLVGQWAGREHLSASGLGGALRTQLMGEAPEELVGEGTAQSALGTPEVRMPDESAMLGGALTAGGLGAGGLAGVTGAALSAAQPHLNLPDLMPDVSRLTSGALGADGALGDAGLAAGAVGLAGTTGAALGSVPGKLGVPDLQMPEVSSLNPGSLSGAAGTIIGSAQSRLDTPNLPGVNLPDFKRPDVGELLGGTLASGVAGAAGVALGKVGTPDLGFKTPPLPGAPALAATARPISTPLPPVGVPPLITEEGARRGGGWLWALPLALLLGLGGCYLSQRNQTALTAPLEAGTGGLAILTPASGAAVAAGAFDLSGTGKAGDEVEVFGDGASLGKATVGADGKWTLNVPSATPGKHTYEVKSGTLSATSLVTVGAASTSTTAAAGAACTKDFALALKDGATVRQPFPFGGQGGGKGYNVTVTRGGRTIGVKQLPLGATCAYGYTSQPGKGDVTYSLRAGSDASGKELSRVTLNVQ